MPDFIPFDLIKISDGEQSVTLRVIEGMHFSGSDDYDALHAEVLIGTDFLNGRVEAYLNSHDLDAWGEALDALATGRQVTWLESGRSPRLTVSPQERTESGCTEVSVYDVVGSQVFVTVPVATEADWIARHRELLAEAGNRFPLTR
ncbi:DUF5959 family protein [Streptomyces sp. NBC_00726]|uniref:DUF5959 family protein n=1 Tax=Streptomyces sp. NBC_00726 TaxID=2903674 RepID=UPI00386B3E44